jgi:hypothetical protein
MPVTLSHATEDDSRILVAATASGNVLVWRVQSDRMILVHQTSNLITPPPQTFIALDDALGDIEPGVEHVTIGAISQEGHICFWTLQFNTDNDDVTIVEGSRVKTGKTEICLAKASAGRKTALGEFFSIVERWTFEI